jgi:hypothetical protein
MPPLPAGIEARFYEDPHGLNHIIILWHPVHQVGMQIPLEDKAEVTEQAAIMARNIARAKRSVGAA